MSGIEKLREDERGVTVIIGVVLIFMILAMLYTTIQVYQVPLWNKGVEYEHMNVVYDDMMSLKADIENVAMLEMPKSSNIHMGVRYPDRVIFTNPGIGVAGMLTIDNNVTIRCDYTLNVSGTPTHSKTYNSSRIIYEEHGTINSPKLVYEHGIIIRDWGTTNITTDKQSLIVNDEIYIPVVNGSSSSISSMETESLEIKPYTQTSIRPKIKYVNITMDTKYPEVWQKLLADVNTSYTTAYVSANKIIINSSATRHIVFLSGQQTSEALYAGKITFGTAIIPVLPPGYTNIDSTKPNWPCILDISIKAAEEAEEEAEEGSPKKPPKKKHKKKHKKKPKKTHSLINATVKNVTAPYDIHADLSDITKDSLNFDVQPDYSDPDDIDADSWNLPNENEVGWSVEHPEYGKGDVVTVTFWVVNTENNMQFYTTRAFYRKSETQWES